jgi:histone H3/H4
MSTVVETPSLALPARRKIRKPRHAIPKMAFRRLVEEIASGFKSDLRFQPDGLDALQESAETVLTEHFERCAQVAGLCKVDTIRKEHWEFACGESATLLG